MDDQLTRFWQDLVARVGGPMSLRLLLQPAVAVFLAVKGGLQDAREGRPPYFWALLTDPGHRREFLRDGWHAIAKVFGMALVLDVVYQFIVRRWVYPFEALLVGLLLACVPYLVTRGPVNWLVARLRRPRA
jgi:hypothetical protein